MFSALQVRMFDDHAKCFYHSEGYSNEDGSAFVEEDVYEQIYVQHCI